MKPDTAPNPAADSTVLDALVCFDLYAASRSVTAVYRRVLAPHSLTYPQFLVLTVLWARRTQTASQLVQELHLDHATLTPLLQRMDGADLTSRTQDTDDKRVTNVSLGPRGEALRPLALDVHRQISDATGLTQADGQHLQQLLRSVRSSTQTWIDTPPTSAVVDDTPSHQHAGPPGPPT